MGQKGYKGFDQDFKCRGFQFKEGETYETDKAVICESGFHFCENPHNIFSYYSPGESRFAEVEALDKCKGHDDDSKQCTTKLKINSEVSIATICKISVSAFFERFKFFDKITKADTNNAGDYGAANAGYRGAANAGDCGAANAGYRGAANAGYRGAANAGDYGAANAGYRGAANAGDCGAASVGKNGVAIANTEGKVKGNIGSILVLVNRDDKGNIIQYAVNPVDGKKIKADTFYTLKKGKFVEVQ